MMSLGSEKYFLHKHKDAQILQNTATGRHKYSGYSQKPLDKSKNVQKVFEVMVD